VYLDKALFHTTVLNLYLGVVIKQVDLGISANRTDYMVSFITRYFANIRALNMNIIFSPFLQ